MIHLEQSTVYISRESVWGEGRSCRSGQGRLPPTCEEMVWQSTEGTATTPHSKTNLFKKRHVELIFDALWKNVIKTARIQPNNFSRPGRFICQITSIRAAFAKAGEQLTKHQEKHCVSNSHPYQTRLPGWRLLTSHSSTRTRPRLPKWAVGKTFLILNYCFILMSFRKKSNKRRLEINVWSESRTDYGSPWLKRRPRWSGCGRRWGTKASGHLVTTVKTHASRWRAHVNTHLNIEAVTHTTCPLESVC